MDAFNALFLNNPVSQKIISTSKKILFKNNGEITSGSHEIVKTVAKPFSQSLFDVKILI